MGILIFMFFKQKTEYEMRIRDLSSDVCSSDLLPALSARALCPVHAPGGKRRQARSRPAARRAAAADRGTDDPFRATGPANSSQERRVGTVCVITCRFRLSPSPLKNNHCSLYMFFLSFFFFFLFYSFFLF